MIDVIKNPKLTDFERRSLAIQVAYNTLNAVDFNIVICPFGSMQVSSRDGNIVLDSKECIRYDEY